ncbi:hypothetical protein COD72_23145 [Bacillus cereus]|nr:hypothetical protein CN393_30670 [Bacillus cereus]PGU51845.1 hypothetical protein COD72_23145 [Bacillus cereus]
MKHLFYKIDKFISVKILSLYLVIMVLFPVLLKFAKVSSEVLAFVYTFNVNITSSIFILVIFTKSFIELFKHGLSK